VPTEIRLVNGSNNLEGRVEILYNGRWRKICDDSWTIEDAYVICRQFGRALQAIVHANFGQGTGTIWLENVLCIGNETRIEDCPHNGWGTYYCDHSEDEKYFQPVPLTFSDELNKVPTNPSRIGHSKILILKIKLGIQAIKTTENRE